MAGKKTDSRNQWKPIWFIESLDDGTENFLRKNFSSDDFFEAIVCADGIGRNLWQCDHNQLLFLFGIEANDDLHYRVFMKKSDGLIYYQASAGRNGE